MQNSKEKLADFTALSLWVVTSLAMAAITFLEYGQDFRGYYAAARVLLDGGNPYDYTQVSTVLLEVTGRASNNPFYYPLWFGWLISPLSLLPFQIARARWMLLNLALWLFGLIRLQQLMGFPRPGWRGWLSIFWLRLFLHGPPGTSNGRASCYLVLQSKCWSHTKRGNGPAWGFSWRLP